MTRERAKELLPVITAFAEGKSVERIVDGEWVDARFPQWYDGDRYRIKASLVLRPWKLEEVPVGCLLRENGQVSVLTHTKKIGSNCLICAPDGTSSGRCWYLDTAVISRLEHSTDFGETWHPCGVVEDAL